MNFFNKMKEPVFLKESSNAEKQLQLLKELQPTLNTEGLKTKIQKKCRYLKANR